MPARARVLIDRLLGDARGGPSRSHNAVAAAIAQNRADWGVAIEPVARLYGLAFLPIGPEDYDFLLVESRRERPAVQAFLAALRDETVRERIRALGMQPADMTKVRDDASCSGCSVHLVGRCFLRAGAVARPRRAGARGGGLGGRRQRDFRVTARPFAGR